MKNNKGYTLIELMIVLGIIAVLSAMSFVTLNVIKQAQYNAAASTLSNQMGSLLVKTKALSEAKDQPLCMLIHRNSKRITLNDGKVLREGSYSLILGYDYGSTFIVKNTGNAFNEDDLDIEVEDVLTSIITIQYDEDGNQVSGIAGLDNTDNMIIEYDKATGGVRYGAGKYDIIYKNGDRLVATVSLDATTGNHYLK